MAFGSTITLTVDGASVVLNRINQDNYGSEYSLLTDTDSWNMKIRHSTDTVDKDGFVMLRHNVYLEHYVYITSTTPAYKSSVTATFRAGKTDGITQITNDLQGLLAYLAASSYAACDDLVVGLN